MSNNLDKLKEQMISELESTNAVACSEEGVDGILVQDGKKSKSYKLNNLDELKKDFPQNKTVIERLQKELIYEYVLSTCLGSILCL